MDLREYRQSYEAAILHKKDLDSNPFSQFKLWFEAAVEANINEPNAMTLATASKDGKPSCRSVLLKHFDASGFAFYTNYQSRKAKELSENPRASILFLWKELERQVTIEGLVIRTTLEDSQKYFKSRPVRSQIGAWASQQDNPVASREVLESAYKAYEEKFSGLEVTPPPHWGGFILIPNRFEFWQGRIDRLHDRLQYTLEESKWVITRLSP